MNLMAGRGSDECFAPSISLSVAGAVSVPQVGSRMYLLRCPTGSIFLPGTLGFGSGWFHGCGPCGNCSSRIDCIGPDSPLLARAI